VGLFENRMMRLTAVFLCVTAGCLARPGTLAAAASVGAAGAKIGSMSVIYGVVFALSGLLLAGYLLFVKKKTVWFILLYLSVFIVNGGYFMLSVAQDLDGAMLANQISYFGAAMLPLAMLLIIADTSRIRYPKRAAVVLCVVSFAAFLLAASGSDLGLYYTDVYIEQVNGVTCLHKVYGPLHFLYTVYLFAYFGMMLAAIVYASVRRRITSCKYVAFLASAVGGNLVIWFVEQLIHVDFEFLSVSYIITELLLLLVHSMRLEYDRLAAAVQLMPQDPEEESLPSMPPDMEELFSGFAGRAKGLTAAERSILAYYADGREIAEVAELAFISIHTVRKHNANMYQKLGVGSRDELMLYLDLFRRCGRLDEILQAPETAAAAQTTE